MLLTSGQTYFCIFCVAATAIYTIGWVCVLIKIHLINNGPCKKLKTLEQAYLHLRHDVYRLQKRVENKERSADV